MGIMVYSLLWVMQDFVHQQYHSTKPDRVRDLVSMDAHGVPCFLVGEPGGETFHFDSVDQAYKQA